MILSSCGPLCVVGAGRVPSLRLFYLKTPGGNHGALSCGSTPDNPVTGCSTKTCGTMAATTPIFAAAGAAVADSQTPDLDNLDFQLLHEYLFDEPNAAHIATSADGEGGGSAASALAKRVFSGAQLDEDDPLEDEEGDLGDEEEEGDEEGGRKKRKSEPRPKSQAQIDRRRERNRILARRTRLRKKFFFESLQKQVAELQRENLVLKDIVSVNMSDVAPTILKHCDNSSVPPIVTEHSDHATEMLNRSDFTLMRTLQVAQRSFCITDPSLPDNPIVFASQDFLDSTGYTMDQVLGRNCRFLQGPETDRRKVAQLRRGIVAGVDTAVCLLNYRADGSKFWNQLFVAALRDVNRRIVNYVGVQCAVPHPPDSDEGEGATADDLLLHDPKAADEAAAAAVVSSEGGPSGDAGIVSNGDDTASSSS